MSTEKQLRWWSSPRALLRTILMLDDTSHSIALGTAIGMAIGLSPTVGIQMILVMVTAWLTKPLFRFNRVAGLITVYISNPITVAPIYFFLYWVGTFFGGDLTLEHFSEILNVEHYEGNWLERTWALLSTLFVEIGWPLVIGACIVAPIGGIVTYPSMLWLLQKYHGKKHSEKPEPEQETVASASDVADSGSP